MAKRNSGDQMKNRKPFVGHSMDWVRILARDPKRKSAAIRLAFGIAAHVNNRRLPREAWPFLETLAEEIGLPRRNVERYLTDLDLDGLIERERRGQGQSNLIRLTEPDTDAPSVADEDEANNTPSTADQSADESPLSADQKGHVDPPHRASSSAKKHHLHAPSVADPIEELKKEPENEPLEGGAAHQAPASDPVPELPPTPAPSAARGATGGRLNTYTAPTCTLSSELLADLSDTEPLGTALELLDYIDRAEGAARDYPALASGDELPNLSESEALALIKQYFTPSDVLREAQGIREWAILGKPDLDLRDAPVVIDAARELADRHPMDRVAAVALAVHLRAWRAYHVNLSLARLLERAERVAGCTWNDLFMNDDEVPF